MKNLFVLLLCSLFLTGCQTMGKAVNNEHSKTHIIDVEATGENKRFSKKIYVKHVLKGEDIGLVLIGDVERPMGVLVSLVKVKARFMDDKGLVIKEEGKNVYFRSVGLHGNRKYKGTFYVEILDNPNIVKCEVEFI